MRIAKAILIKKETTDGLVTVKENVPIGKEYFVDLDSRRMAKGYNFKKQILWERKIINTVDSNNKGWWPTELLRIEEEEVK